MNDLLMQLHYAPAERKPRAFFIPGMRYRKTLTAAVCEYQCLRVLNGLRPVRDEDLLR